MSDVYHTFLIASDGKGGVRSSATDVQPPGFDITAHVPRQRRNRCGGVNFHLKRLRGSGGIPGAIGGCGGNVPPPVRVKIDIGGPVSASGGVVEGDRSIHPAAIETDFAVRLGSPGKGQPGGFRGDVVIIEIATVVIRVKVGNHRLVRRGCIDYDEGA